MFLLWCIIYSRGFLWNIFCVCFKKTSIWVCLLSEIPPWNTVSIIWCGWVGVKAWKQLKPEKQKIFHFSSRNADFRVLCYNGIIIFRKMKQFAGISFQAHGMWSTSDEEINHNVYIWAGFECWRSQTNYGWQNKGLPIVNRTFRSEGNSFLKRSSESSSTLNGQQCLTSALKLPRKYFFHSFHVIVFSKAGGREGRERWRYVRSFVNRF